MNLKKNPDNEDIREIKYSETQCFSGFWDVKQQKNLHQLMQEIVQTRKNRIICTMSGQFQSELPIF